VSTTSRSRLGWILRGALAAAGVAFIAFALHRSLSGHWRELIPTWPRLIISLVLLSVGLALGGLSWFALLGPGSRSPGLVRGFFFAALSRYVPGGIWQPLGQVGSAAD
jgi:hypothetical protein